MYSQRLRQLLRSSRSFIRRRDRAWRGPVLRLGAWADDIRRSLRVRSRWVSRHVDRRCSYYQGTTTLQVALLLMMTVLPVTPSNEGSSWHTRSNHDFRRPHGSAAAVAGTSNARVRVARSTDPPQLVSRSPSDARNNGAPV